MSDTNKTHEQQVMERLAAEREAVLDAARAPLRKRREELAAAEQTAAAERQKIQANVEKEQRAAAERTLRAEAWDRYPGTRESFEADWPAIRAKLIADNPIDSPQARQAAQMRRSGNYNSIG